MVRTSVFLMTGVAFSFGLLLGLLLHLPGVSSPVGSQDHVLLSRKTRSLSSLETAGDSHIDGEIDLHRGHTSESSANTAGLKLIPADKTQTPGMTPLLAFPSETNRSRVVVGAAPSHSAKSHPKHHPRSQDQAPQNSVSALHARIKQTYASIQALRSDTLNKERHVFNSVTIIATKSEEKSSSGEDSKDSGEIDMEEEHLARQGVPSNSASGKMSKLAQGKYSKQPVDNMGSDTPLHILPHKGDIANDHPSLTDSSSLNILSKDSSLSRHFKQFTPDIVDGVYWGSSLEILAPSGFTSREREGWRKLVEESNVVAMQEGCGRMQNRQLTFVDATRGCARYRINTDQVQGEIYSYYLARLLDINNLPPSVLLLADSTDPKWMEVNRDIIHAEWNPEKVLVVTPWMDALQPAYIPQEFRLKSRSLNPTKDLLQNHSLESLVELLQWSDLIVFDYLTANVDRVVNNMFNLQWNSQMMENPTHNLEKSHKTASLVFLDNESGLFHSYRLLDKYAHYHDTLLQSLCIFRRSTAENIKKLHRDGDVGDRLMDIFKSEEPLHDRLPRIPASNVRTLQSRIAAVYDQITRCESTFSR